MLRNPKGEAAELRSSFWEAKPSPTLFLLGLPLGKAFGLLRVHLRVGD